MQYARCKCGKSEVWSSGMPIATCRPCSTCGSVPAASANSHPEPTPHDFSSVEMVDTDEGKKPLTRCRMCHKTKSQIDKEAEDDKKPEESNP